MDAMTNLDADQQSDRDFSLLLDDQMCFALYAASRAVPGLYRPILEKLGATPMAAIVRRRLRERVLAGGRNTVRPASTSTTSAMCPAP